MGRLTVRLPTALHQQLEVLARNEGVSLNQYMVYALTRQATLDAYLRPGGDVQPRHTAKAVSTDPRPPANEAGESDIRHVHGGGLPPPNAK